MKRTFTLLAVATMALAAALALGGCSMLGSSSDSYTPEKKSPTIASPTIGQDGVLRVGVNSSNAPFSAQVSGNIVGIDVDVAAALADQLGLDLQIVDVGADPEGALDNGSVDIVMSVDTSDSTTTCWTSQAYLRSSVALFSMDGNAGLPNAEGSSASESEDASGDADAESASGAEASSTDADGGTGTSTVKIAAQSSSMSAWEVTNQYGADMLESSDDLKSAFSALSSGSVNYVAADAVIGSYVAHSNGIDAHIVGIMENPSGYCVGVSSSNTDLQNAVSDALNVIVGNGVVPVIERKWLGSNLDVSSYAMTEGASTSSAQGGATSSTEQASGEEITTEGGSVGSNAVQLSGSGSSSN